MLEPMKKRLLSELTFETATTRILHDAIALNGAEYGTLQLAADDKLLLVCHKGFMRCFLDAFRVVVRDDGSACGRTLRSGKTVLLEDIERDRDFARFLPVAREAGFRSVISAPLLAHGNELVGVVATHFA